MNWVGILWPMISGSCLTLAFIYCLAWWRAPARISHLMLAVAAASVAAVGLLEVAAMTATEPAAYARMIRWAHVPVAVSAACVIGFVFHHYGVGSPVLAILAVATRFACLVPNFLSGVNLNYASIDSLRPVTFLGTQVSIPDVATPNPWMLLGTGNALLIAAFLVQAIVQLAGRRPSPERTRAIVTCTTILVFVLASGVWTWLLVNDRIDAPHLFAPMFLGVLLAMAYTLAGGFSSAGRLAHSLEFALGRRRQARRRMLQAVDAAGVGYWTIDTGSGRVRLSHRASALLDVPPRQAMTREELLERLPETDREALVAATGAVGEGEFHSEFRVRLEDGGHRWLGVHGRAVTEGGRRSLDGVVVDITSRKESESRFRLVVEAASAAHLVVAPSGKVAFANRAAAEIFGDTAGGLEGMDFHALVRAEGEAVAAGDAPLDAWPGSTAIGETVELAGIRDGGATTIALAATFNPVPLDSELYLLVSLVDLSEQRRVEREAALQRDEIAHLSRVSLLETLSGSLAHELNQPLAAILANAQAARRFLDAAVPELDEVRASLTAIAESDLRAAEIIRRLRALLRKDRSAFGRFDVGAAIEEAVGMLRNDLLIREVELQVDVQERLAPAWGDSIQVQQVLLNLVMNACDASSGQPPPRRIRIHAVGEGGRIRVTVTDHGVGIAAEDLERIFQPFHTGRTDGLGLGLAVCRTIIQAHQGEIWAESRGAGSGAAVSFRLPSA